LAMLKLLYLVDGVVSAMLPSPMANARLNQPPATVAVVLAPIAIATESAPLAEQDALPDFMVPNADDTQASSAWAGAGATLADTAVAATAPSTPPAINTPAARTRWCLGAQFVELVIAIICPQGPQRRKQLAVLHQFRGAATR